MTDDRRYWLSVAERLATPVLENLARGNLKKAMPCESGRGGIDRERYTHLEALGRLLAGIAPWLELDEAPDEEGRGRFAELARAAIDAATDPASRDYMNFSEGGQPMVDAAFLALAFLRAPRELWEKLDDRVRDHVTDAMKTTRKFQPPRTNWVLFASTIEAMLRRFDRGHDAGRLESGLHDFQAWYLGDGAYGDGPDFSWDYYNSFVIHPMLIDVLNVMQEDAEWETFRCDVQKRATRFAAVQERLIAPDGSFPVIGRSIAYRCGAFHLLAQVALLRHLPEELPAAQVRSALTAVLRRTLDPKETFDGEGWLRIGLAGHQPRLAEHYISTGSLYLCSCALLPLGLPEADPFWSEPALPWTSQKAWSGTDLPADHAL